MDSSERFFCSSFSTRMLPSEHVHRIMDCFDPFKDYFELEIPRGGCVGNEESPILERRPDMIVDRTMDCIMPNELWPLYQGSVEHSSARPVLGRRDSVDDASLFSADVRFPQRRNINGSDHSVEAASNSTTSPNVFDYEPSSIASSGGNAVWSSDHGVWSDVNSEINGQNVHQTNGMDVRSPQNNYSVWNTKTNGRNNGMYSSTGFFGDSCTSVDTLSKETIDGSYSNQTSDEDINVPSMYPHYSNGQNVEYPESIGQVAFLLNKLIQQGNTSVPYTENGGFRNFRSLDEGKFCAFCKRNRERREFYTTHVVKDSWGKVICPILRKYTCPICGATGDSAHTLRHCPARPRLDLG